MRRARQSGGFSLAEMALALALIGILAQGIWAWKQSAAEESRLQRTVDGFLLIDEALVAYRIDHGAWPGSIDEIAPYLPHLSNVDAAARTAGANGWGLPYSIGAAGAGLEIATETVTEHQAGAVARAFPATGSASGTRVAIGIPVPGLESSHDALLARDGSRPMTGTLAMGGHDIADAGAIAARSLSTDSLTVAAATAGESCGGNAVAPDGAGALLCCRSGAWAACGGSGGTYWTEGLVDYGGAAPAAEYATVQVPSGFAKDECRMVVRDPPHGGVSIDPSNPYSGLRPRGDRWLLEYRTVVGARNPFHWRVHCNKTW